MSQWVPAPRSQVRIGDAERDQAVSELGEHFVAGRLTQEEFNERSGTATYARYADDLAPLFEDLPGSSAPVPAQTWPPGRRSRPGPPPFVWLAPAVALGLFTVAVVLTAPWVLWLLFGLFLFRRPGGRGWHGHQGWHGHHHYRR